MAGQTRVLLVAHYDSVPKAPGAGDDAAAVVALPETLRILQSGPPLKNDIIVLFTMHWGTLNQTELRLSFARG